MTVTGYSPIGTILKIGGSPVAAVFDFTPPAVSAGSLDTTTLNPTNKFKTSISDQLITIAPFDINVYASPSALATFQGYLAAGTQLDVEIDFTDGDGMYMNAANGGSCRISGIKPISYKAGSTATDAFTLTLTPSGAVVFQTATGHWYDSVDTITIAGGDFGITSPTSPKTLQAVAIVSGTGFSFYPPVADLTFTSGTPGKMTVGAHTGIVTWVATGTSIITVDITAKSSVQSEVTGTAS